MAKFCGVVGYSNTMEIRPGVWEEQIEERHYVGDVLRNTRKWENGESKHDNLVLNNQISIVSDSFGYDNFFAMKYVRWDGAKVCWEITNAELSRPRIIITVGGIYNGNRQKTRTSRKA